MPLNLIFITPGNYTIKDDGIVGNNTSAIYDGSGAQIFTFVHPVDSLGFTVSSPGVNITLDIAESLGAANLTIGSLTDTAVTPDSIVVKQVHTTGAVVLASNGAIIEGGSDAAADIVAGSVVLSAVAGVGTGANAIETQVGTMEAETDTGGINIRNAGSLTIGGLTGDVAGLNVATSGNIQLTNVGSILLNDDSGPQTVHGGNTSGNVTLVASGFDSDIISIIDQDAITTPGGSISLTAGRDIGFGIIGANFDNDVRARGSVTLTAGRDILVDGFADLVSDDFGASTGGNFLATAGRNIHLLNVAGTDAGIAAGGNAGADVILATGAGGAVIVDAASTGALSSFSGDVRINTDRILISASSGISANLGAVMLDTVTDGRSIILGSAGDGAIAQELSDAELDRIFTQTLIIGDLSSGPVSVIADISPLNAQNLQLVSGTDIQLNAGVAVTQILSLVAGDNLYHTAGSITAGTLMGQVDSAGDDEGTGGLGAFGTVTAGTIALSGGAEADTLTGAEGVDQVVHGNGGNDVITSSGEGQYFGDEGDDTILGGLSSGLPEVLDGGTGTDTLDTTSFSGNYVIDMATGVTNFGYESFVNFEHIITGDGNDSITGSSAANNIRTGIGNDTLDGGLGGDTMTGGAGDDAYYVNSVLDVVVEAAAEGTDAVLSSAVFYTLGANVDHLTLAGAGDIDGTGNDLGNFITGNNGANTLTGNGGDDSLSGGGGDDTLNGGVGVDTMAGRLGNDVFIVNSVLDVVIEDANEGADEVRSSAVFHMLAANVENLVLTGSGDIDGTGNDLGNVITGNGGANTLNGNGGNDTINGGTGVDTMTGGLGNDTFTVNSVLDVVTELVAEGVDEVLSSAVFYTLGANVENLTLTGSGAIDGNGNTLANTITGNAGDNVLDGDAGNDTMIGGLGDDTYVRNTAGDVVTEAAGQGNDLVQSAVTHTLEANVERLTLTGAGNINGMGNAQNNVLTGNAGNNTLNGSGGADTLSGLGGDDTLVWDAADTLVNGGVGDDTLRVVSGNLDLTSIDNAKILNVETISLAGGGNNVLTLNTQDVLDLSTTTNTLTVLGDAGDSINIVPAFTDQGIVGGFHQYTFGAATLLVDLDIASVS